MVNSLWDVLKKWAFEISRSRSYMSSRVYTRIDILLLQLLVEEENVLSQGALSNVQCLDALILLGQYGTVQKGLFFDIVSHIFRSKMFCRNVSVYDWPSRRQEYVDRIACYCTVDQNRVTGWRLPTMLDVWYAHLKWETQNLHISFAFLTLLMHDIVMTVSLVASPSLPLAISGNVI